tara:strand:- start:617 stop:1030 length:414 start_codon:yes stop_codon:yes gene_type:complete
VGLISHQLEEAGIATVGISTAKDITRAVRMPRAAFLDFPQGFTAGKPKNTKLTIEILKSALKLVDTSIDEILIDLEFHWAENDEWKDSVFNVSSDGQATDDRLTRLDNPQYQSDQDRKEAQISHKDGECLVCMGIDY